MNNSGIILLNKSPGITSFDALRDIKRALGTGKVGHTGTLDKFACGLLVVLAGKALRLSKWFTGCEKEYEGRICFGEETETLDPEGAVTERAPVPSRQRVEEVLKTFTGEIMQAPPAYSAIHVNGKRASELARSGEAPQMKERKVTIYKIELLSWQPPFADIFVHCSSGTYIRSLARDIALAADSRAHLAALKRTKVGGFSLVDCSLIPDPHTPVPVDKSVIGKLGLPVLDVTPHQAQMIKHGKPFSPQTEFSQAAIFSEDTLIAVMEKIEGKWKYGCVF
jgi:tRNA pseudouridine55 synthase